MICARSQSLMEFLRKLRAIRLLPLSSILRGRHRSTPLLFYVADLKNNTFQMRCFVDHHNITDIPTYLRLCGRQHKRKYVAMSVMGSMTLKVAPVRVGAMRNVTNQWRVRRELIGMLVCRPN
jgi:hypothetical protein